MVHLRDRWQLPFAMAGLGLALGAVSAAAWRFATPTTKAPSPAAEPGFHGEIVYLDNKTVVTPAIPWMPEAWIYPAAGVAGLLAVGLLMTSLGWQLRRRAGGLWPLPLWFSVLGGVLGAAVAILGVQNPPVQPNSYIRDGGGPGVTFDNPKRINLGPIMLTYPIIGICIGFTVSAVLALAGWRLSRTADD